MPFYGLSMFSENLRMVYERHNSNWVVQEWPNDPTIPGGKGKGKSKSSVASKGSAKGKMNGIASFLADV